MKFKTTFTLFTIFICFNLLAQESFEGSIKFKTEITTAGIDKEEFKKELDDKYGDSLIVFYSKKGMLIREFLNSANLGNHFQVYEPKEGVIYLLNRNSAKIDTLNVKINSLRLINKKKTKNEIIVGLQCECFEYSAISKYDDIVILNYCFSEKTPKIDPNFLEKHNDFFLNEYFKNSERPYLKFSIETTEFKIVQLATEIKEHQFDNSIFDKK